MAKAKTAYLDYKYMKKALADGDIGRLYIFFGEEVFLREYCVDQLRKTLVEGVCEALNHHVFSGNVDMDALCLAVDTYPVMNRRSLVVVNDFDLFGQNETVRERLVALLSSLPDYCCLVFVYDTIAYKPDGRQKKLTQAVEENARCVSFDPQSTGELTAWIQKKLKSLGRDISREDAEHLIFLLGGLMTGLTQEIEKLAAFSAGKITRAMIDELVEPTVETVVFDMTNAIADKRFGEALSKLRALYQKKEEPVALLSVLGGQLRQFYTARLALEAGKNTAYLQKLWGLSPYAAELRVKSARRFSTSWCAKAVKLCAETDLKMKSTGFDKELQLEMLLLELSAK